MSEFLGNVFPEEPVFPTTHACSNGGTAFFENSALFIEFTDCQIGDAVLDGNFGYLPSNASSVGSTGLSIATNPDTTLQFDGNVSAPGFPFYQATNVNARVTSPTGELSLSRVNTQFSFTHLLRCCVGSRNFIAEFNGSFDFALAATHGQSISAETTTAFRYSEPRDTHTDTWNYRTGVLKLAADDGSEVILDADTGDDTTVSIRLNSDAGIEDFIQSWAPWQDVLRRVP